MNFVVSPHTHTESFLTASTLPNLIGRAKELGRTHFVVTDNGHLSSAFKAYSTAKKAGLKPILGIEAYFKDDSIPELTSIETKKCKYFTISVYAHDQEAYQEIVKIASKTDLQTIEIHEETQSLWTWAELEHLSKYNISIVLGGIHCIVGKTLLANKPEVGMKIFQKIKDLYNDRMSVSILAEPWTKKWQNVVKIEYVDGTYSSVFSKDTVSTDKAKRIKAIDLTEKKHHERVKSIISGGIYSEIEKVIEKSTLHSGFLPLPGGDASLKVNKFLYALANKFGVRVLVTDYAYYAHKEDKIVQTMVLEGKNKLQPNLHMKASTEVAEYLSGVMLLSQEEIDKLFKNNEEWAKGFDGFNLKYEWRLAEVEGDKTAIQKILEIVKASGRIKWDDPRYVARLKEEIEVIHKNGIYDLSPYFLPIRDVLNYYKENGELVGCGRGSSGASLLCYGLGITQLDPIKWNLPFQRFFSMTRIKQRQLPDIDLDLGSRLLLVGEDGKTGYLYNRWGNKAAQISTRTTVRLKSAILDTNRYFKGEVEESIVALSKGLPAPPQGISDNNFVFGFEDDEGNHIPGLIEVSDSLKKYSISRPEEWDVVSKAMGLTRAFSKHASAFVIADKPIHEIIPTKEGNTTQYEAKAVEENGLVKYDFLVINILKDIELCLKLINKKNNEQKTIGYFTHQGKELYIWDLPEIGEVFRSVWSGETSTLWQINTHSMIPYVMEMLPNSVMDLATLLALVRPGPLDYIDENTGRNMTEEYMARRRGESEPDIKEMGEILKDTLGILCIKEGSKVKTNLGLVNIEDVKVNSLVQTENGSYQKVLANIDKGYGKTIAIRSDNAEEIIVTPDHQILTSRGWIQAKDLTDRDLIAHQWISDKYVEDGDERDWLVGLMLADGDITKSSPVISAGKDRKIAEEIKIIADRVFGINSKIYFNTRCWYVRLSGDKNTIKNSNVVSNYLKQLGIYGKNCYNKAFPKNITKSMIIGFIEGDGCIFNKRIRIKNESMARSIFETLQALRIKSSIYIDKGNVWCVSFDIDQLPFKLTHKIVQANKSSKGLMYPKPKFKLPRIDGDRQIFMPKRMKITPFISNKVLKRICDKYNFEYDFSKTWSKVLSIKESGVYKLYDLSIENIHSFVVGGCIVHNCFQEDLNKIARNLAGFSAEEAETLRANMAKKKMIDLMKMKPSFISGAKHKVSEEVAEKIWEQMVTFGRYGFSIIHAVEYGLTTYASMFLKYYYPLEWWASILSNASEQEISTKFWPHVKDFVMPPDINLSGDTMVVDYANQTIRSKLGIIRGMGDSTIEPIVNNRPYKDINDFVNKEVAGDSTAHKLIHVGVLDSLFPPRTSLIEKLKMYQQAVEDKKFADKVKAAQEKGKTIKALAPKEAVIPEKYLDLHPLKDAAMRKSVLPSLPVDLFALGSKYSKVLYSYTDLPAVKSKSGHRTPLLNGDKLRRLYDVPGESVEKDIYVAATCFVLEAKEFSYAKNTKKALKMNLDADGFIKEFVMWPDYNTGALLYPSTVKKGAIVTVFFRKKVGRKDLSVLEIVVETEAVK